MGGEIIPDDEIVYRRIPPQDPFFEPPDRVTTANFRLRKWLGELGVSTYRASLTSVEDVLAKSDAVADSFVVAASVGEIRALKDGNGKPLNLDVVAVDDQNDRGHAEIRSPKPGSLSDGASKALRNVFKRI